jgi:hypothetical protein
VSGEGRESAESDYIDVYVVTGPRGFTETFNAEQVETLVRLGLIQHDYDGHVLEDGAGQGVGALHHFYREVVYSPGQEAT